MRLNTGGTRSRQARNARRPRQLRNLALAAAVFAGACGRSETDRESDRLANAANPAGLPADRAGLSRIVGGRHLRRRHGRRKPRRRDRTRHPAKRRQRHRRGGAMYFAMAVTLPSAAGLGSSGACIVHDTRPRPRRPSSFRRSPRPAPIAGQPFTVPSSVRAITLMHIRHGQMRWQQIVAPAERLAPLRRAGVARAVARSAGGWRRAGRRSRGTAHLRQGERRRCWPKATTRCQSDLAGTLGAHPPARRRRLLPGQHGTHPVRAGRADGRQPAARGLAQCRASGRAAGLRGLRHLRPSAGLCRAAAGCRRRGTWPAGRARRQGPDPDQFRRLLGPGRGGQQGRCGRVQPVDGPALRRAAWSCPAPACCLARRRRTAARSAR